jgi:polyhydroxyalkanoate synthesis regulator phasin
MRSKILKAVYTGLGLVDTGRKSIEVLARQLAEKAAISEEDGEQVALKLRARSNKALKDLHKTMDAKVQKVIETLHAATRADLRNLVTKKRKAHATGRPRRKRHPRAARTHAA